MNASQQPLEISRPMWTVFAIVMGIAVLGMLETRDNATNSYDSQARRDAYFRNALTVTRHIDVAVELPQLGVVVTPADGWSCLTTVATPMETRPTWVNEQARLLARLSRFPFADWPPALTAADVSSDSHQPTLQVLPATESSRFSLDTQQLVRDALEPNFSDHLNLPLHSVIYQHLEIEWIRFPKYPALDSHLHLGRIPSDAGDLLLTVIQQSPSERQTADQSEAIKSLCDQIAWLSAKW